MTAPPNISKIERLRARDGDLCWLCNKHIDFKAEPNSAKAWSLEHLVATVHGGPNALANMVLCHPPCNRVLGERPLKDKIRLRERRQRKLWLAQVRGELEKPSPKIVRALPSGKRLKGLDEFETPEFVGRMARVQRKRDLTWAAGLLSSLVLGAALGLLLF